MNLSAPSRRLLRGVPALPSSVAATSTASLLPALQSLSLSPSSTPSTSSTRRPIHTTRSNQWFWSRKKKDESTLESQVSGTAEARNNLMSRLTQRAEGPAIFEDEAKEAGPAATPSGPGAQQPQQRGPTTRAGASLVKEHLARAVDPDPRSRARWERKMVIRAVRRGTDPFSKEPRAERIARTERQLTTKSPFFATSVKKLVKLAHQIRGKTVAEALTQMRFSNKKMAREVHYQLEIARDLAVAERGMGLGAVNADKKADGGEGGGESQRHQLVEIRDKDGKWVKIDDPTRMYVAEAWVNRGPFRARIPDYRARGRMNIKMRPSAGISIVIKEEKTRIREHAEREAKKLRHGPWIHLPDRPVTAQRPYYSW
ncbi:hypothetical protein VTK26DRAFT_5826 [Humicola hyalothermophila]